jgi:hypothetical protein
MLWSLIIQHHIWEDSNIQYNGTAQNKWSHKELSYREEENIKINFRQLGLENINWNGLRMVPKRVTFLNGVTNISVSWFPTFTVFWMLYMLSSGELPRRRHTTYQFHMEKILDQHTNYQLCVMLHFSLIASCVVLSFLTYSNNVLFIPFFYSC